MRHAGFSIAVSILAMLICSNNANGANKIAWLWDTAQPPAWSVQEVAIVVDHILLRENSILERQRSTSPSLQSTTRVTPVVHVEISTVSPPKKIENSHDLIVSRMAEAARMSTSGWVQLDMEARPSQWEYYAALVRDIRTALPDKTKLSVTTLAWWCRAHTRLAMLDADEIVPMFFRMGRDASQIRNTSIHTPDKMDSQCRSTVAGFATNENFPAAVIARYTKTYWFDRNAWRTSIKLQNSERESKYEQ
jgi:hypothetical protein